MICKQYRVIGDLKSAKLWPRNGQKAIFWPKKDPSQLF